MVKPKLVTYWVPHPHLTKFGMWSGLPDVFLIFEFHYDGKKI